MQQNNQKNSYTSLCKPLVKLNMLLLCGIPAWNALTIILKWLLFCHKAWQKLGKSCVLTPLSADEKRYDTIFYGGSYPMKNTIACWLMTLTNCAAIVLTIHRPLEQWPGVSHHQYMPRLQPTTIAFFSKTLRMKIWFMETRNNCGINTIMKIWCMLAKIYKFKRRAPWNFSLARTKEEEVRDRQQQLAWSSKPYMEHLRMPNF